MSGLFHIYTGDGKGKTSAALGLLLRASGYGMKILYCQFLKSGDSGEHKALTALDNVTVLFSKSIKGFIRNMQPHEQEIVRQEQQQLFKKVESLVAEQGYDLVVLDEIINALNMEILSEQEVADFIIKRGNNVELVFTGQNAPAKLINQADYVSNIVKIKHPYDSGIEMRGGIEY